MKARELVKRAVIYGLGLGIYAYELFVATVEGLGLNARGFWGEPDPDPTPTPMQPEPEHVASNDPIEKARAEMLARASSDFDRWNKMTPAERAKNIQTQRQAQQAQREKEEKAS